MASKKLLDYLKKNGAGILDYAQINKGAETFKGQIMDRAEYLDDETIVLKLDNGYNVGINLRNIDGFKLLKKAKEEKAPAKKNKKIPKKGFISILHTGGTIASKVDYRTGGVVCSFDPEELISMFPKLSKYGPINSVFMGNMFSDDMRFKHYAKMADFIKKEIELGSSGIIIAHGTDTMAYSSAALSFILENIPIPVIFVGAQRSSDRPSSDAEMNLVCAAKLIRNSEFLGVAICMHDSSSDDACAIISGVNAKKMHTSKREAFRQINDDLIAIVEYQDDDITFFREYKKKKEFSGEIRIFPKMEEKVGILKIHPNMFFDSFDFFKEKSYKGLIIEGTGLGHCPISEIDAFTKEHSKIKKSIEGLIYSGCIAAMCSQAINGAVNMNVYSPGRDMLNMGMIGCDSMCLETAFCKLSWLLANHKKDAKKLMAENLRGEIKKRIVK